MWRRQRANEAEQAARDRVKQWVFVALGQNPDVATSINEIVCYDPGCPGTETIILVMVPGKKTAATKIGKGLAEVSEDDVRDAMRRLA